MSGLVRWIQPGRRSPPQTWSIGVARRSIASTAAAATASSVSSPSPFLRRVTPRVGVQGAASRRFMASQAPGGSSGDGLVVGSTFADANALATSSPQPPGAPVPSGGLFAAPTPIAVVPTSSAGPGGVLAAPTTELTGRCNMLGECLAKADELAAQMRAQERGGAAAQVMTQEGVDEFLEELKQSAGQEFDSLVTSLRGDATLVQRAGMHELRRALYYAVTLRQRDWLEVPQYTTVMRSLTVEFLRRDYDGALAPDDVLYITTHVVVSDWYNRQMWNRLEQSLFKYRTFENIDIATIKGLSTRLFKTRPGAKKETLDIRRKILGAMAKRVGTLANDFDLPSLLGIIQCYTVHDSLPRFVEPLCHRAINHIADYTPQECATLAQVLRKWKLMKIEICEKMIERICTADNLTFNMVLSSLGSIRTCFARVSDGGRGAVTAEPTRQKLRALGEQVCCRLDEVTYPAIGVIMSVLNTVVQLRIYVPKKCLHALFKQATALVNTMLAGEVVDEKTQRTLRLMTMEQARDLQMLLSHYGAELAPDLSARLKQAIKDGLFPDEASQ